MAEATVAYKATMNRMGIYIQETQVDEYIAAGYTVYKITTEVLEASGSDENTADETETSEDETGETKDETDETESKTDESEV